MRKIEMPDFYLHELLGDGYANRVEKKFKEWFYENIEGKYLVEESELIEVTGFEWKEYHNPDLGNVGKWAYGTGCDHRSTHKAYLIKSSIELIKKETAEDVLRRILKEAEETGDYVLTDQDFIDAEKALEAESE